MSVKQRKNNNKIAEPAQACCKLLVSRLSPRSQQAVAATKLTIGEPKILHSILSLFQTISISCLEFGELGAREKHSHSHLFVLKASVDKSDAPLPSKKKIKTGRDTYRLR